MNADRHALAAACALILTLIDCATIPEAFALARSRALAFIAKVRP